MATSATPEINKVALYALLLQSATSNELRDFCFRLEVTYESVVGPNDVVQTAIQKTINYFEARGRLPELLEQGEPAPDCVVQRAPRAKPEDSIVTRYPQGLNITMARTGGQAWASAMAPAWRSAMAWLPLLSNPDRVRCRERAGLRPHPSR